MTSPVPAAPVLVAVAHGTSSAAGRSAIGSLVAAVAARRPDLTVRAAFVDVQPPDPAAVLSSLHDDAPARLVPLLLSAGYHVYVDLAGAAGSSQASAVADCERVAAALGRRLGRPVVAGYLSAAEPKLAEAVAAQRVPGRRVVVATYLLAPGFFADLAGRSGADVVTPPLLLPHEPAPEALVDVVVERYLS